jgi:hypothetical protein
MINRPSPAAELHLREIDARLVDDPALLYSQGVADEICEMIASGRVRYRDLSHTQTVCLDAWHPGRGAAQILKEI